MRFFLVLIFFAFLLLVSCGGAGNSNGNSAGISSGYPGQLENLTLSFLGSSFGPTEETYSPPEVILGSKNGTKYSAANMLGYRTQHTSITLGNGNILVYGGRSVSGLFGNSYYSDFILYNFEKDEWKFVADSGSYRDSPVLTAAGQTKALLGSGDKALVLDTSTNELTSILDIQCRSKIDRTNYSAITLQDGKVLLTGGIDQLLMPEIFDPQTNCFKSIESSALPRSGHKVTAMNDGKILISGGNYPMGKSLAIYDPNSETAFDIEANLLFDRAYHGSIMLEDGRILIVGGWWNQEVQESAEIFDPSTNSSHAVGNMNSKRFNSFLYRIPRGPNKGKILIVGGLKYNDGTLDGPPTEIFDPTTEQFSIVGDLNINLPYSSVSDTKDGRILITGGFYGSRSSVILDLTASAVVPLSLNWWETNHSYALLKGTGNFNHTRSYFRSDIDYPDNSVSVRDNFNRNISFKVHYDF